MKPQSTASATLFHTTQSAHIAGYWQVGRTHNCSSLIAHRSLQKRARYYESSLSIWLSVDPLSDKYPSLSPYVYCANNPVILVDPDGRSFGDFYDLQGEHLGDDGIDDNQVYLVTDKSEALAIKENTSAGKTSSLKILQSAKLLPDREALTQMYESACNAEGEEEIGGHYGNTNGDPKKWEVTQTPESGKSKDGIDLDDKYVNAKRKYYNEDGVMVPIKGTWHVHAWGNQPPSPRDLDNAERRVNEASYSGPFFVFGKLDKNVYIYNGAREVFTISNKNFEKIIYREK